MIISFLIIGLFVSFSIHLRYLIRYVIDKEQKYLRGFLVTAVLNITLAIGLSVFVMMIPELSSKVNVSLILWIVSGVVLIMMLIIKISILKKIYKRCQLPENYHFNFFGKKVLHPTVVRHYEVVAFFTTIPIFLLIGAYFVARLINLLLYGNL